MMDREYDQVISQHYEKVADEHGLSPSSTMADEITRQAETRAIIEFVGECLRRRQAEGLSDPAIIMDVGCGNGYTLEVLLNQYPEPRYVGIEKSDKLRALAETRFSDYEGIIIKAGDIRNNNFFEDNSVDIMICQRVIINLLSEEDQFLALDNIIRSVKPAIVGRSGGKLIFIEGFKGSLANLNRARNEFDLPPILASHHNLYLPDNFFDRSDIIPFVSNDYLSPPNFLSTHYYVSRVLHPIVAYGKPEKRNSEFVRFFSRALNQFVGDYSPLKLYMFEKVQ
jgi:SAM-dependent methyltransferase